MLQWSKLGKYLENFVLSFNIAATQSYHWTLEKINRPYQQFSLLGLRAQPSRARWLIFNCATTFTVMVMLLWALGWLMFWERPKTVERGRRRSVLRYRGADKSLAKPGRKQARKHVRDARDFNNIETRAVIKFFPPQQGTAPKEIHAILRETVVCFLPGRAKDLSAPLYCPSVP